MSYIEKEKLIVVSGEYPKDCLHCNYRHCLHIGNKYYQMCGLCGDGYLTESWFKSEDLVDGFKSEHCPIQGEYEEVFNHDLSVIDMDYLLEKKEMLESEDKE